MNASTAEQSAIERIQQLEALRYSATVGKDTHALAAMLDHALMYVHSDGTADTRSSYLQGLAQGVWDYHAIEREESRWAVAGGTVLLFCTLAIRITVRGEYKSFRSRALVVWRQVAGDDWRLLGVQSAAVASL